MAKEFARERMGYTEHDLLTRQEKGMINVSESFQKPETGWRKHEFSTGKEDKVLRFVRKTLRHLI